MKGMKQYWKWFGKKNNSVISIFASEIQINLLYTSAIDSLQQTTFLIVSPYGMIWQYKAGYCAG